MSIIYVSISEKAIKPAECAGRRARYSTEMEHKCVEAMLDIPNYVGDAIV